MALVPDPAPSESPLQALRRHWPEYLIEAGALGVFMVSAGVFTTLVEHPASPLRQAVSDPWLRHLLTGLAMGATAALIVYSPWGKRSGAHINPAVTLTFLRLGKVAPSDAAFYVGAQFFGAVLGVLLVAFALGVAFTHPTVNYVATLPGRGGLAPAFLGELIISFLLMLAVLSFTNARALNRYTGLVAGLLVALYITIESPLSGMSMNPARSFGSAVVGHLWTALWVYFTAPLLGMLLAAQLFVKVRGASRVLCAKFHHENDQPCPFRCGYRTRMASGPQPVSPASPVSPNGPSPAGPGATSRVGTAP